jgi:hypothetical protein
VIIEIRGPKALDVYKDFAKGKGTWIKADGKEILSVTGSWSPCWQPITRSSDEA